MRKEQEEAVRAQIEAGEASPTALAELPLPELPYVSAILNYRLLAHVEAKCLQYRCRQIMTRPDFLEGRSERSNATEHLLTPDVQNWTAITSLLST